MLDVNATWRYAPVESWKGTAAAVAVLSFDVDAETPLLAAGEKYAQHLSTMSHQVYGPTIGVPRIIKMLGTSRQAGHVLRARPDGRELSALRRGHPRGGARDRPARLHAHAPVLPHAPTSSATRSRRGSPRSSRYGVKPFGYRAPMWQTSKHTLEMLGEYGIRYDSSLMDDDRPYLLDTPSGRIAEMCPQWYLDDWEQYVYVPDPDWAAPINRPSVVAQLWIEELEGERETGSLFMLTCHPFASGRPGRIKAIEKLIEFADECGDVVFTRGDELAQRLLAVPDASSASERPD